MSTPDPDWVRRHVALFRTQRGHWCQVEGCTGSQPLMWVPTREEVQGRPYVVRGSQAIDWLPPSPLDAYLRGR